MIVGDDARAIPAFAEAAGEAPAVVLAVVCADATPLVEEAAVLVELLDASLVLFPMQVSHPVPGGTVWRYPYLQLRPILEELYGVLGPRKLVWGSDLPNIQRNCTYRQGRDYLESHDLGLTGPEYDAGWFVAPTVVTDLAADARLVQEEVFGPVLAVQKFHTEIELVVRVDPDRPSLDLPGDAHGPGHIARPDCPGQAVLCAVRELDG